MLDAELDRVRKAIPHVHLQQMLQKNDVEQLKEDYDFVVIAAGAQKPRSLPIPGSERMITALEFLQKSKTDGIEPGKRVVVIGAGNVGCDAAVEAHRLGAEEITLIDVQKPASFGKEREHAEAVGAQFKWPCFTQEVTEEGVVLQDGEVLPADTVVISIGDQPELDFLPDTVKTDRGFVAVNEHFQTSDPKIFAVGDIVKPGLITDAIGAGRRASAVMNDILEGKRPSGDRRVMLDKSRVTLEYFDPRITEFHDTTECGSQCASCGACRDCSMCVTICPQAAITRQDHGDGDYEYVVDSELCIGCGFCTAGCPCGIWTLMENEPMA